MEMTSCENFSLGGDIINLILEADLSENTIYLDQVDLTANYSKLDNSDINQVPDVKASTPLDDNDNANDFQVVTPDEGETDLNYMSSLLDDIFNRLRFKINRVIIRDPDGQHSLIGYHIRLRPTKKDIKISALKLSFQIGNPYKISLHCYKSTVYTKTCHHKITYFRVKSAKLVFSSLCLIKLTAGTAENKDGNRLLTLGALRLLRLNIQALTIYDNYLKLGLQLHCITGSRQGISIRYLYLMNLRRVFARVAKLKIKANKSYHISRVYLVYDGELLEHLKQICRLTKQHQEIAKMTTPNIVNDYTTQAKFNSELSIIENYQPEKGDRGDKVDREKPEFNLTTSPSLIPSYFNSQEQYIPAKKTNTPEKGETHPHPLPLPIHFHCHRVKLLFYDQERQKCSIFRVGDLKYQVNPLNNWKLNLKSLSMYDLTSSLWKNILYKLDPSSFLTMEATYHSALDQTIYQETRPYSLVVKLTKFAVNLDEFFLKKFVPLIGDLTSLGQDFPEYYQEQPLYIINCLVKHIKTVLSYKPRGINLGNILGGKSHEIIRLGTIRDMELDFYQFMINHQFGLAELGVAILKDLEHQLAKQGSTIISHIGIFKQLFSPGLRAGQVLAMDGGLIKKVRHYAKYVSSDALELATRTSIGFENTLESILGKTEATSKLTSRNIFENLDLNLIVKGVTISLLKIQRIIDPQQDLRNKMRYGS